MTTIGERLFDCRKSFGITQVELADYLGMTQSQVARLEKNIRTVKPSTVTKLSNLYNVSEEYIYEGGCENTARKVKLFKGISLNDLAKMNKIICNIEYLSDVTKDLKE